MHSPIWIQFVDDHEQYLSEGKVIDSLFIDLTCTALCVLKHLVDFTFAAGKLRFSQAFRRTRTIKAYWRHYNTFYSIKVRAVADVDVGLIPWSRSTHSRHMAGRDHSTVMRLNIDGNRQCYVSLTLISFSVSGRDQVAHWYLTHYKK